MKAIFVTGGKQYYASEGDILYVEKLDGEPGSKIVFDQVLVLDSTVGMPYVKGAKVEATIEKHGKSKKIVVFKYKPKKKYRNKQGHRQPYTKIVVNKIIGK